MLMSWKYAFILGCFLFCTSFAQTGKPKAAANPVIWEPPSTVDFPDSVQASVPKEMITSLRVAGQRIVLEETDLKAVQSRLGGTIGHSGDGADSVAWLCLGGSGVHGRWVLWLMGDEISGGTVGGFRWQQVEPAARFDPKCQVLPRDRSQVELPIAIQLGTSESDVVRILGPPTRKLGDTLWYLHEHALTIKNQPCTLVNDLSLTLHGGMVRAVQAWKSTTS